MLAFFVLEWEVLMNQSLEKPLNKPLVWFPLIWLIYLVFPILSLFQLPHPIWVYGATCFALLLFVIIYGKAFFISGSRPNGSLWNIVGMLYSFLLAILAFPLIDGNVLTFLVYACSMIGFQPSIRLTFLGMMCSMLGFICIGYASSDSNGLLLFSFAILALGSALGTFFSYRNVMTRIQEREQQKHNEKLAQLAERERIARDLHDVLGHSLSVIVLKSELASKLAERDITKAIAEIRDIERISRETLAEVRSAVRGYRGSGLKAEFGRAKVALDAAGVSLSSQMAELHLPPSLEPILELTLREAITNVVRHSRAKNCQIQVLQTPQHIQLEVSDDGVGMDSLELREGTGLSSIRERLRAVGGTLEVNPSTSAKDFKAGTRLRMIVPLEKIKMLEGDPTRFPSF